MSIGRKITFWIISILLIVGVATAYLFYVVEMKDEAEKLGMFGRLTGRVIEENIITYMQRKDNAGLNRKLEDVKKSTDTITRIWLLNRDGVVKAATDKQVIGKKFSIHETGCRECHDTAKQGLLQATVYRWAVPIENKPACHVCHNRTIKNNGVLLVDFSTAEYQTHVRQKTLAGLLILVFSLTAIGVILVLVSRKLITNRLDQMGDRMKDFQMGDMSARAPLEGRDEITRLEVGFNRMAQAISTREQDKNELVARVNSANDQLQEQLRFLQLLIDTIPMPVFYKDRNGVYLGCNKSFEAFIGLPKEKVIGKSVFDLAPKELAAKYHEMDETLFNKPGIQVYEYSVKHSDGAVREVIFNKATYLDGRGNVAGLLGAMQDITDRKKAEQVIQRNYDAQTAINWVLHISLENISLQALLKQTLDLLLTIPWLSLESRGAIFLVEEDPNKLIMKAQRGLSNHISKNCSVVPFGKCLCGRAAARGEVQFADCLDERHEVHYEGIFSHGHYCVPIMHQQTVLGVINMYLKEGHKRDSREIEFLSAIANALAGIIQRKRAEEEREKLIAELRSLLDIITRSHKDWQNTFDSITDMIAILDKDFTILKANKAFSAYYGLQPRDVISKKCYELAHQGDSPIPNCPHRITVSEKKPASEEFYDEKTKKMFRVFTFPYFAPDGSIIGSIHVARDITDDKEKEMRLIMSERLAALGQMASGIAHEINNPLASIAGCSEGLLSRVKKDQWDTKLFESYLGIIQEEVFRCKNITTAMLSFVRKNVYEKKDIVLHEMLDKTLEIIGFQGRMKNIDIIKRYDGQLPIVHGNEGELRQVFLAVIINALDAMDDKGTLTVEAVPAEAGAVVRISDTGEGISLENITKIFDPFFTTKSGKGGTGLGLSIARKIITNHNGTIDVDSKPGTGTTITITLIP